MEEKAPFKNPILIWNIYPPLLTEQDKALKSEKKITFYNMLS